MIWIVHQDLEADRVTMAMLFISCNIVSLKCSTSYVWKLNPLIVLKYVKLTITQTCSKLRAWGQEHIYFVQKAVQNIYQSKTIIFYVTGIDGYVCRVWRSWWRWWRTRIPSSKCATRITTSCWMISTVSSWVLSSLLSWQNNTDWVVVWRDIIYAILPPQIAVSENLLFFFFRVSWTWITTTWGHYWMQSWHRPLVWQSALLQLRPCTDVWELKYTHVRNISRDCLSFLIVAYL